ncbi:MAG: hypothetical protein ACTSUX_09545 [Promethearchaeota archaeon]
MFIDGDYAYLGDGYHGLAVIKVRERLDILSPIIRHSSGDLVVEQGYTGITISWTAWDENPSNYMIELEGSGIVKGPSTWSNGVEISYDFPDGFSVGVYTYSINLTDDYNNSIVDEIKITVQDTTKPTITSSPSNLSVDEGYIGVNFSWTATDLNPNTYFIERQGYGIIDGPYNWSSGSQVTFHVPEGLISGDYIFIINFTDDYGNSITDSVKFTVKEVKQGYPQIAIPFGNAYLFYMIIGIFVLIIIQQKKKLIKN